MKEQKRSIVLKIIETNVYGALAYHFECGRCLKVSKRRNKHNQAVQDAKQHICAVHGAAQTCPNCGSTQFERSGDQERCVECGK